MTRRRVAGLTVLVIAGASACGGRVNDRAVSVVEADTTSAGVSRPDGVASPCGPGVGWVQKSVLRVEVPQGAKEPESFAQYPHSPMDAVRRELALPTYDVEIVVPDEPTKDAGARDGVFETARSESSAEVSVRVDGMSVAHFELVKVYDSWFVDTSSVCASALASAPESGQ